MWVTLLSDVTQSRGPTRCRVPLSFPSHSAKQERKDRGRYWVGGVGGRGIAFLFPDSHPHGYRLVYISISNQLKKWHITQHMT